MKKMPTDPENDLEDSYLTVKKFSQEEIKIKGSRFIGRTRSVHSRADAESFIADISQKHFDATHNCYAYRIGLGSAAEYRYSDDGEPSGTAGAPILKAIDGKELTNAMVVVTRYFGGTKLGTGGLVRAYSSCAQKVLESAGRVRKFLTARYMLTFPYELQNAVMKVIASNKAEVVSSDYGEEARLLVSIRKSNLEAFNGALLEESSGRGTLQEA